MIKYCIEKWDKNKDLLRSVLNNNELLNHVLNKNDDDPLEYLEYKDLVKLTVMFILNDENEWDVNKIKEIDDGDYQGTLLYLIPEDTYQPNSSEYLMTFVEYGSCSGCDTLQGIQCFLGTKGRNESINDLMSLCKDLICNMIKPYNTGWRYDERFSTIK